MQPEMIICGKSGSGKDAFAELMGKHINVARLAMADPMKRFCMEVFDFSYETLWGPSELRNVPDPRYTAYQDRLGSPAFKTAYQKLENIGLEFVTSLYASKGTVFIEEAYESLELWFNSLWTLTTKDGLSPRVVLQSQGTEWARAIHENTWVNYAGEMSSRLLGGGWSYNKSTGAIRDPSLPCPDLVAITDGRFPNEVLAVKARGGLAVKVVNPTQSAAGTVGIAGHASETAQDAIPDRWFDAIVVNDKSLGLAAFESKVQNVVGTLLPVSRF